MEMLEQEPQSYGFGSMSFHQYATSREFVFYSNPVPEGPMPADIDGIPGVDIRLVSRQTGLTDEQSLDALRRNNGDIVNSIMELVSDQ
jgi:NACalpha-BTF3-like transcription factor